MGNMKITFNMEYVADMNKYILVLVSIALLSSPAYAKENIYKEMVTLKKQAEKGNTKSAIEYGERCLNIYWQMDMKGKYNCIARDGFLLIKKLADKGNADAQEVVGENLYLGHGQARNYSESFNYLLKSAIQGNAKAAEWVANYYAWIGVAVQPNPIKAYAWYSISYSQDDDGDNEMLKLNEKEFEMKLTSTQLIEAQQLAKKCQESNFQDCN